MMVLVTLILSILLPAPALAQNNGYNDSQAQAFGNRGGFQDCPRYHTIIIGETLLHIAEDYGVDPQELAQINDIDNPNHIFEHQRLCIPEPGIVYGYGWGTQVSGDAMAHPGQDQGTRQGRNFVEGYPGYWTDSDMQYPLRAPVVGHDGDYRTGHPVYPHPDHGDNENNDNQDNGDVFEGFAPALMITSGDPANVKRVLRLYLHESDLEYLYIIYIGAIILIISLFLALLVSLYMRLLRIRI